MMALEYGGPAAGAFALALAFRPALRLPGKALGGATAAACAALLSLPLLSPAGPSWGRLFVVAACAVCAIKLVDLSIGASRGRFPSWGEHAFFLVNPFSHVERKLSQERRPPWREDLRRLARGSAWFAAGAGAFAGVVALRLDRFGFAAEHAAKTTALFLAVYGGSDAASALWRLCRMPGRDIAGNFFAAPTPAEFWRRYNRPVTQYLFENVYRPAGGNASPVLAGLAAFAVSAAVHEYLLSMTLGRVQGLQTAFFLLQGAAAVATSRLRLRGAAFGAAVAATLAFNLVTSALFLASATCVLDIYRSPLPAFLRW